MFVVTLTGTWFKTIFFSFFLLNWRFDHRFDMFWGNRAETGTALSPNFRFSTGVRSVLRTVERPIRAVWTPPFYGSVRNMSTWLFFKATVVLCRYAFTTEYIYISNGMGIFFQKIIFTITGVTWSQKEFYRPLLESERLTLARLFEARYHSGSLLSCAW